MPTLSVDDEAALANMKKVELHVHIEGGIAPEILFDLAWRNKGAQRLILAEGADPQIVKHCFPADRQRYVTSPIFKGKLMHSEDMPETEDRATLSVDFSIGPGVAGRQLSHVKAGIKAFIERNLEESSDGIVSHCEGTLEELADAIRDSVLAAFRTGASHYRLVISNAAYPTELGWKYVDSLEPVIRSLGSQIVPLREMRPEDIPLEWEGRVLAGVREKKPGAMVDDVLPAHIIQAEARFGALEKLDREGRAQAIVWFRDQSTFNIRYSVDRVATKMGVSRATIYNYLKAQKA